MLVLAAGAAMADILSCDLSICAGTSGKVTLTVSAIDNTIVGKNGPDTINDILGPDKDTLKGNAGNDKINALEGNSSEANTDLVNCGPGKDTVFLDNKDKQSGCEKVHRS